MSDDSSKKAGEFVRKLFEGFPDYQRKRLMQSHCIQDPEEKKARVKLVQELSLELAEIRKSERFILFGETAIEAVMEGDWKQVADVSEWLTFSGEAFEYRQHMARVWTKYREALRVACVEARHRQERLHRQVLGQEVEKN